MLRGIGAASEKLGLPLMVKSRTLAYDGRGNYILNDLSQAQTAISSLGNRPLYAERLVSLSKEIAVMVVRTTSGEVKSYPAVETVHKDNICNLVFAPLIHSNLVTATLAQKLAEQDIATFSGAGIFGVEMFLLDDGESVLSSTTFSK